MWQHNQCMPQEALNHETSLIALKQRQESHRHLFKKKVVNHPGPDTHPCRGLCESGNVYCTAF
jgi:hypothetical protein